MYQKKICGKRKFYFFYSSLGSSHVFPGERKIHLLHIYKYKYNKYIYVFIYISMFNVFFSWKCIHLHTYVRAHKHLSNCMHVNICDSKLDLKTSVDKVYGQSYLFQFHFFLGESRHMITSPPAAASRSYHINSDNLT